MLAASFTLYMVISPMVGVRILISLMSAFLILNIFLPNTETRFKLKIPQITSFKVEPGRLIFQSRLGAAVPG